MFSRPVMSDSLWPMDCSMPGLLVPHRLMEFAQVHVHCISDAIQPSHPWHPLLLLSIFPSIRDFSNELAVCIGWPKYWRLSISLSNEYSLLISLKNDWFDLLVLQGTLRNLFQHHSLKALHLLYSPALTTVHDHWEEHSLDYMDLCWQSNVSAFQNTSRFVEAFLPRSKCLLVSWLQSPSTLIL